MTKFKLLSLLLIAFLSLSSGCTKQDQYKETDEFKKFQIVMSWYCDNISTHLETEKLVALKKCSHENIYCKSMLGNIYYRMKQYDKAYDLLIESQGVLKGYNGASWAPSEMALGEMYAYGRGVSKDKEEAKNHFTKCSLRGNRQCISWMISYAKDELKDAQQENAYRNSNSIDYAARNLLYWYTVGGGDYYYGDGINELKNIIINKKIAEEWQINASKLRDSFIVGLVGLEYTYPYCDRHLQV